MNEPLFLIGVGLILACFAVRLGALATAARSGRRDGVMALTLYLAVFILTAAVGRGLSDWRTQGWSYLLSHHGASLHMIMALGMGVWGWRLLRPRPSESGAIKGPVVLAAMVSGLSPAPLSWILAASFLGVWGLVFAFRNRFRLGADLPGYLSLIVSSYFLLSLAIVPAYAKASEIYALSEQINSGSRVRFEELIRVAIPTLAVFGLGLWAGFRKHRPAG